MSLTRATIETKGTVLWYLTLFYAKVFEPLARVTLYFTDKRL